MKVADEVPSATAARRLSLSALPPENASVGGRVVEARGEPVRGRWRPARGMRARILASYLVLLTLSSVLSIFAMREVLFIRLEDRTKDALRQEALELDRLLADGRDPQTGRPFASLGDAFDVFFARNVPSTEEALLAFVGDRMYRSNLDRFPIDRLPAHITADWSAFSRRARYEPDPLSGRFRTEVGDAYFRVTPVRAKGGETGAFAVTILPAGEVEEIGELLMYGAAATLALLLLASAGAWFLAGRVLAPVRQLTDTARSISQSDLTRRIDVRGADEAAEMARTFNEMLDRLGAVFRSQREFVRDASHELRDPLTISRGHLELLGDDPEERRRTLAIVMDELDRMGRIVDDLQLLAEAERPDFLTRAPVDVGRFARELATKASALGPRRWRLDAADARGTLVADRHRLTEAVLNLAHNAVKHTGPEDAVAIGAATGAGEVRFWVEDTGPGIAEADQPRVFERFVRGGGASRRYRGSGLGLAIVKAIADAHGGEVRLESRPGEGSRFTLVLPRTLKEDDS